MSRVNGASSHSPRRRVEHLTEMGASAQARRDIEKLYRLAWHGRAFGARYCAGVLMPSFAWDTKMGAVAPQNAVGCAQRPAHA